MIPVLADFSYAFNNEGVAKWYAGILAGATGSQISGTSDRWDFTLGAKAGVRFDVHDWLTLAPEIYGNNVFLGGTDYQIWGAQALLGMRF